MMVKIQHLLILYMFHISEICLLYGLVETSRNPFDYDEPSPCNGVECVPVLPPPSNAAYIEGDLSKSAMILCMQNVIECMNDGITVTPQKKSNIFLSSNGYEYRLTESKESRKNSSDWCHRYLNGRLVIEGIRDCAIRKSIVFHLNLNEAQVWIGLQRDSVNESLWIWDDEKYPLTSNSSIWSDDEPNNQGGEECATLQRQDGRLNDIGCNAKLQGLCEIPI